ncbi:hypothetical protein N8I77_001689 [Diaporthe amygdali]|uniref:Uncharacterized protein n=1 Tax=Phomopsis amygdali TaxID=1214568 RepID=A0AAD9WB12_PHOAM|nr:hypothetical protein N8I77_001689 [Diaporthe amygdali]
MCEAITCALTHSLPATMVAIQDPKRFGLSGGGKDWESPEEFDESTEAYTVSIMHQLHCLADFKNHFLTFRNTSILSEGDFAHLSHCVEIVRRGVMCKADLALETPDDPSIWPRQHVSGWGNLHVCRDWDSVMKAIKEHAITRGTTGWRRIREDDPPLIVA